MPSTAIKNKNKMNKKEKKKREQKEIRDYFMPTPAKSVEEAEDWCKRQLERKCNKQTKSKY